MTEEQKDILIAKMLDAPSSLSDKELESILSDKELREIYEMSAAVSGAYIYHPDFNMMDEWNLFRPNISRKSIPMRWIMRVAAIFLGVVIVGGVMVRVIDKALDTPQTTVAEGQDIKKTVEMKSLEKDIKSNDSRNKEDSQSLITVNKAASSGQYASKTKTIKKDPIELPEDDIDIDTYLRIQQARIDNDLAMMTAECYLYEYNEFLQELDDIGAYDTAELENTIRLVTMQ